jgi:hypothetical protein
LDRPDVNRGLFQMVMTALERDLILAPQPIQERNSLL